MASEKVTDGEWTSPSSFALNGIPIPRMFTPDPAALHDYVVNFQTRHDDVFIVSYPKSVFYGLWHKHVLEWWKHKDDSNVLFLKYEDLKKDLSGNIQLIAEFLEKHVSADTINKIAHQCTFKEMAKNMATFTLDGPKLLQKGEIGDWKNYFTPDIAKHFESEVMKELMDTGLTFDFEA